MIAEKTILDIYPRYSKNLLAAFRDDYLEEAERYLASTGRGDYRLSSMFDIIEKPTIDLRETNVVAASLFFKPSNYASRDCVLIRDSDEQIPLAELHKPCHSLFVGTRREGRSFFDSYVRLILESDYGQWKPVVFLASDLLCLKELLEGRGIAVFVMEHASISHNPGAMWRYLAFNLDCRSVYLQDTDRIFNINRSGLLLAMLDYRDDIALVRKLQRTRPKGQMALILGNDFVVRPDLIDLDVETSMLGYIVMNVLHEDRLTNFVFEPSHSRDPSMVGLLSNRIQRGHPGPRPVERVPLKCFPYYGFPGLSNFKIDYNQF